MKNNNVLLQSMRPLICQPKLLCSSGQKIEDHSLKQENLDNCSSPMPQESKSCGFKRKVDEMPRFDLNTVASTWDDLSSNRVIEQVGNERSQRTEPEGLLLKERGSLTAPLLPKKNNESDSRLILAHQEFDSGVCLDLQLKQPCIPGPQFNWADAGPDINDSSTGLADLSLSLASKLSGESSALKPEQSKENIQKNREEVELGLPKFMQPTHVKSEQCEVTVLDAASAEVGTSNLRTNSSEQKAIQAKQLEVSQMNREQAEISLDAKELVATSSRTCFKSKFEIDLNSDPVDSDVHTGASAPLEASEISNSSKSLYYDEAHKSTCFTGNAEENAEKVSISVSKSVEVEGNDLDVATEQTGAGETASGSLLGSSASKENESTACDGGYGDYTDDLVSEAPKTADTSHMEADRNSDVSENGDEIEAPAEEEEESGDSGCELNTSHCVGETVLEQLDEEGDFEYEDIEVTVSNDEGESSIERTDERKVQDEEGVDSKPENENGKDTYIENPDDLVDKREGIAAPGSALQAAPSEKRSADFACRGNQGAAGRGGNKNVNWRGGHSLREVFVANGIASNQEVRRSKRGRPIMKYTGHNQSSYKKTIANNGIPVSSQTERGRSSNNTYRHSKPHPRWHSEESRHDRFHEPEGAKGLQQLGRRRSDFTWVRRDPNRLKMVHEDGYAVASDIGGSGRPMKKWFRDERQDHDANEVRISGRFQNFNHPTSHSTHFRMQQNYGENSLLHTQDGISGHTLSNPQDHYQQVENTRGRIPELIDRRPIHNRRKLPLQPPVQHPYFAQDSSIVDRGGVRPIPMQGARDVSRSHNIDINPRQTREALQPSPYNEHGGYEVDAEFVNERRFNERQGAARPFRQQQHGERRIPPSSVENSDLRPNRYPFKKGRNDNGYSYSYSGTPARRGRY